MSFWEYDPYPYDMDEPDDDVLVTCKYCGVTGLSWVEMKEGWRLHNADGDMHRCNRNDDPAIVFAPPAKECRYTKRESDPYGTDWTTACGHAVRCEGPVEVGFSFDPLPNADGKFCPHCGKLIEII